MGAGEKGLNVRAFSPPDDGGVRFSAPPSYTVLDSVILRRRLAFGVRRGGGGAEEVQKGGERDPGSQ
jgi:hypothetical protein